MPRCNVGQLGEVYDDFMEGLRRTNPQLRAEVLARKQVFEENGSDCTMPVIEHLDGEIWQIRAKHHRTHARLLYFYKKKLSPEEKKQAKQSRADWDRMREHAVIVHTFIKKTEKTPRHDIELAESRRKELVKGERIGHGNGKTH